MCTIRVITFNVQGAFSISEGPNTWDKRAGLNVQTITRCAPDLIGFQEVQDGNLATYQNQLPEHQYFLGPKAGDHEPFDFNPIFWNPARLKLVDTGGFWLSRAPEEHSADWDTAWIRSA